MLTILETTEPAAMADTTVVLETHIYSVPTTGAPPWSRSFHLRLPPAGTKAQILSLIRDSMTRLGRADPVVEAQITLYWTRHGRVVSTPGSANPATTVTLPVWQPPLLMSSNVGYPTLFQQPQPQMMEPAMPLAMTYSGGVNYLHSYGNPGHLPVMPPFPAIIPAGQHTWMMGGGQLGFVNVNLPNFSTGGGRPVVSDVVREARLDGIAEAALTGMLEWVCGPTGLKLIVVVDSDGRDIIPVVAEPPAFASPSLSTTPVAPASPAASASPAPTTS